MERINLPMQVEFLLNRLQEAGFEAYVVGGCVRDSIMGLTPHDWDICTSALPEQVIDIFKDQNVVPTGLKHGTVTVILDQSPICENNSFEITTYRVEGDYKDNRHPEYCEFVSELSLDLMRRDFTINAMAYNYEDGLIDLYGGVNDIKDRIIKCVGNSDDRFQEDALRIIRTIRFALRFGFDIDLDTYNSMQKYKHLLRNISAERISSELTKIFEATEFNYDVKKFFSFDGDGSRDIQAESPIVECLLDLVDTFLNRNVERETDFIMSGLAEADKDLSTCLAVIFDDDNIEDILKTLRFSNDVVEASVTIREHGYKILTESNEWARSYIIKQYAQSHDSVELRYYARKLLNQVSCCPIENIISFAKSLCKDNEYMTIALKVLESQVCDCRNNNEVYKISYLAINGNDLLELGYKGKEIGIALNRLLDMVMKEEVMNIKADLISALETIKEDENDEVVT